jgi:hypothetical protein
MLAMMPAPTTPRDDVRMPNQSMQQQAATSASG